MNVRIVWFRRDLRLTDHPVLHAALRAMSPDDRVIALFVLDPALVGSPRMSPARLSYLCDALADLDGGLRRRGASLVVRSGNPRVVVPAVAAEAGAVAAHLSGDVTPYAQRRDEAVAAALGQAGVEVVRGNSVLMQPPGRVVRDNGEMFRVYSPFRRAWDTLEVGDPLAAPRRVPALDGFASEPLPTAAALGAHPPPGIITGGETAAAERLDTFLEGAAASYRQGRDAIGEPGTSRLSADLHYGCVGARAILSRLDEGRPGSDAFRGELAWRDFYAHVMAAWPEVRNTEFNPRTRSLPWRRESADFDAWREGRTGYPVVDAGMRQLLAEAWMHNRARMVVASFLCKDLLTDWRLGQDHFLANLVDADVASNNGGWQWAAGTGTDAQPFFRVFNPVLQGEKFDPDGAYVRRYVPELARLPSRWIHQPWSMPTDVARECGFVLGRDYPEPIVDHARARRAALAFFEQHTAD